jgi:hypothetical protein
MQCKCKTPCVFYREIIDKSKKPTYKTVCDYRDGEEIKNIPQDEIEKCNIFKSFKEVKWKT